MEKSSVDEIRRRFEGEVERFSNLETGQSATIDAPLVLELITSAAAARNPRAGTVLDIGCGAGNYTIKLLQKRPGLNVTLVDLSQAMLQRAAHRVAAAGAGIVTPRQGDIRQLPLGEEEFDIIMAAAVLHHLRGDAEWESVFARLYRALRPGGSLWISDLVSHADPEIHRLMWTRYGEYLSALKDDQYRDEVFGYIEKEDTPRPIEFQADLLRKAGFAHVEILHKNGPFAAFGALKR